MPARGGAALAPGAAEQLAADTAANATTPPRVGAPPSRAAGRAAAASAADGRPAPGPREFTLELCGVGPVPVRPPPRDAVAEIFEVLPRPLGRDARAEAWSRVTQALDASASERDRAAAAVLRASGLLEAEASPATLARRPDTTPFVRQLATLARQTRDAGVLQWALSVCGRDPALPECQALSVHGLVKLAPEDGRNWLLLAAGDGARRDEAMRRAAQAPVIGGMPALTQPVQSNAPAGLPPYLLQELLIQTIGVQAALGDGALWGASAYCRAATDDRRATCLALADALARRGQDVLDLSVARAMGERLGWPADRVAAAKAEEARLLASLPQTDADQPWACPAVDGLLGWLADRDRLGERAALQGRAAQAAAMAASR